MFKVAENTYVPTDPELWPNVVDMPAHECRDNASIYIKPHPEINSLDGTFATHATVSSTLLIMTEDNRLHFYERVY
jgi:hypothetical protein